MGAKTFINNTPYTLSITLTVRLGDEPGLAAGIENFSITPGEERFFEYSYNDNPYLDAVTIETMDQDDVISAQKSVDVRGDEDDRQLNTHSFIFIDYTEDEPLMMSFDNF